MNAIQRRKIFQNVKGMTHEQFWSWMNWVHTQAYWKGQKHLVEAMECTSGISAAKVAAVQEKAKEIRETWDGMHEISVEQSIDELTQEHLSLGLKKEG
ncbi:hypothetical protein [Paenibacillus gansuensis]|uniref:Phage protein n=1 Tax=Paenibacillus gansuensis TaxID=306542 RepID=A0ABW5PI14_9BACL